jgi:hypothetical protein
MGYKPSIISNEANCYICRRFDNTINTAPLERHHCLHGTGMRKLADEDGLWVWLCPEHHRRLHDKNEHDRDLQIIAQRTYEVEYGREAYFKRYGKFYE